MKNKKVFIVALVANAITACSSPPQLTEPDGDWISFDAPQSRQVTPQPDRMSNPFTGITPAPDVSAGTDHHELPALVKSDGENVPLYKALRTIVPDAMTVRLAPDVAQNFRSLVSWRGGDQWPYVLRKMLDVNGLKADVNSSRKEVNVQYAQKASVPVKAIPVKPVHPADKAHSATVLKTPVIPKVTEGNKPVIPAPSTPPLKTDPVVKVVPVARPAPVLKTWKIEKGTTLKAGYMAWASKETCPADKGKWSVRWETDTDYPIDYPLSFTSNGFEDATRQLFNLYQKAQAPLYVSGYRSQCLIIISDSK